MNFRKIYILLFIILLSSLNCGKDPVFTEMSTNRLKIVIKGTFETEGTSNFVPMPSDPNDSTFQDDSITVIPDTTALSTGGDSSKIDTPPTKIMIDIAEIRLGGKKISNYRHIIEANLTDTDPFFNGTGVEVKTDDPGDGNYDRVQLYIRKMVFNNAKTYKATDTGYAYDEDTLVYFHEEKVNGLDFNQFMVNSYWDSLRKESSDIIRVFPMQIPIVGGMTYTRENGETVLEIRLVIKNFVKKYEYVAYDSSDEVYKVYHYYAPSDWLRDVKAGETDIGRNLHAVARSYVTGNVASSVTVNYATAGYIVAVPSSEESNISLYGIDVASDSSGDGLLDGADLRKNVGSADLPKAPSSPGSYIEPMLDYYLKYENYKYNWNNSIAGITADSSDGTKLTTYEKAWDIYEDAVHGDPDGVYKYGMKIPPYVAYNSGTSVSFTNMSPGDYTFYYIGSPASYGALFLDSAFSGTHKVTQTITVSGPNNVTIP